MQLLIFFALFLSTFTESSSVESDVLSSADIIAFKYSLDASLHWDCPRVGGRAAKAEEARIWQTVIPDARIEEIVVASESRALQTAEQYKWINELSSSPFMQNSALLGMRKPSFDGNTAPVKVLYSKSRQVNQDALSVMLPQLEQSKDKIMKWMACKQASLPIPKMTFKITDSFVDHRLRVPQATNYHPRAFNHPHFTTGDLVAWIALAAASRQSDHAALKLFKLMAKSFLPGFSVSLGGVPTSSAGKPTKTVYLHRSFRYVPAGADLAFYFDGNRGKFLKTQEDSIVLNRPGGIVDGQQHAALVLSSDTYSPEIHLTKADIAMRRVFREEMEKALVVHVPSEVQAIGVSIIRSHAARLERGSFLEAQRKVLEVKPALLTELLPAKLVRLVIDYFSDDTYPFIVSTYDWLFKNWPVITVDSARLYVASRSEGIKSLSHSSAHLREDKRCRVEFDDLEWFNYLQFTSSDDGRYVSFSHKCKASTEHGMQTKRSAKWFTQGSQLEGGRFKPIAFDGDNLLWGLLSRDGQRLFAFSVATNVSRIYQIKKEAGKSPTASLRFEFDGDVRAVSGDGNRVVIRNGEQYEVHDIGKDASELVYQINETSFILACALNEDGSEAAFVNKNAELQIIEVGNADQSAIVTVDVPEAFGGIAKLVYSDRNKLYALHLGGSLSLFDPSRKTLILLESPQKGQMTAESAISSNADYIAILQHAGEDDKSKKTIFRAIVKRKLGNAEWKSLFGYEADKDAKSVSKGQEQPPGRG